MKPSKFLAITSVLAHSYSDKYNTDDFEQKPDIKKFGESKMSHKSKVSRKKKNWRIK